jgi:hypothetical protein
VDGVECQRAQAGGRIARQARKQLEDQTGQSVVSGENYLASSTARKNTKRINKK